MIGLIVYLPFASKEGQSETATYKSSKYRAVEELRVEDLPGRLAASGRIFRFLL